MGETWSQIAARQHGALTERQAETAGVAPSEVADHLSARTWVRRAGGVLVVAGAPTSWRSRAWAGALGVGEPVALRGAWGAALHGVLAEEPQGDVTLAVPYGRPAGRVADASVSRVRWQDWAPRVLEGLPVLTLEVCVREVCADLAPEQVLRLLRDLLRERRTTEPRLRGVLARGLSGSARLRAGLDVVSPACQSRWEELLLSGLRRAGEEPTPQHRVALGGGRVVVLDLAWEDLCFAVEVDGFLVHLESFVADRRRDRDVTLRHGWRLARVAVDEIAVDLDGVVAEILAVVADLRARAARTRSVERRAA